MVGDCAGFPCIVLRIEFKMAPEFLRAFLFLWAVRNPETSAWARSLAFQSLVGWEEEILMHRFHPKKLQENC